MEVLKADKITKFYGTKPVLKDVDVRLEEGELVSILGMSGAGKTTLLNIISGLEPPDRGKVYLGGENITCRPGRISYMLQKDLLLEHKRVIDNVSLPLVIAGMKKEEARKKAEPYFEQFGLEGTQLLYPSQLSGGMRQRAALLRTWLCSSGVVLLDEPFSALDMITKGQMHAWYLSVARKIRLSTILITHDVDEAILLSDRICLLTGTPAEIRHEIRIDVPRDGREGFALTPEFLTYKQRLLSLLQE
jgi:ABC-type nitrate/sulfonate/bicarbonate transport system ATPase subunit